MSGEQEQAVSSRESAVRRRLTELLLNNPIGDEDLLDNLGLFLRRRPMIDFLSMDTLYRMVLPVPGTIMEFGVLHGRHLGMLTTLRSIYEPYSQHRPIVGFDTFSGFPDVAEVDRTSPTGFAGNLALPGGYVDYLREVLDVHQGERAVGHQSPTVVIDGDVRNTLPRYLSENPHTVIALALFDVDLYEPTRSAIAAIQPYLTEGSILAFDELNHRDWPGETAAVRDSLGLDRGALRFVLPGLINTSYLRWPAGRGQRNTVN
ncbi:class I SAM-dependent methyltransferase [Paractinoplanes rishiriensis]|uniref:dTDP-6-deoxy-L-hexose 3-O-methyltransferase n=1 Tax=Paractinoplanes rishiriensis TaxID=1050105 RepID=A0A919K8J0_9ACTN|nr:class I SAM-dependent methyltransferase [Actinoplanes rishiriensis]GIF01358.1 hypothetical protein Ari01nite_88220 [Actinoplanes rishiriensis]